MPGRAPGRMQAASSLRTPGPDSGPSRRAAGRPRAREALTSLPANVHVKEDPRVLGVGRLGCRGRVRHLHLRHRGAGRGQHVRDRRTNFTAPLRAKRAARWKRYFRHGVGSGTLVSTSAPLFPVPACGRCGGKFRTHPGPGSAANGQELLRNSSLA